MARRLISLREMDTLEGLVERHYLLQERVEGLEAEAAAYDIAPSGVPELSGSLEQLRSELQEQLESLVERIKRPS